MSSAFTPVMPASSVCIEWVAWEGDQTTSLPFL